MGLSYSFNYYVMLYNWFNFLNFNFLYCKINKIYVLSNLLLKEFSELYVNYVYLINYKCVCKLS